MLWDFFWSKNKKPFPNPSLDRAGLKQNLNLINFKKNK